MVKLKLVYPKKSISTKSGVGVRLDCYSLHDLVDSVREIINTIGIEQFKSFETKSFEKYKELRK